MSNLSQLTAENFKRLLFTVSVFYFVTCLCSHVNIVYNLLAYIGYLLVSLSLSWMIVKQVRFAQKSKDKVTSAGKSVFITGCDSGFGQRLTVALDKLGYSVYAGCLFPDKEGAGVLRRKCSDRVKVVQIDVTSQESVEKAANFVSGHLAGNKLWALVNNAGIIEYCGIEYGPADIGSFVRQMQVNTFGLIRTTKAFLPMLRQCKESRVVLLGSQAGRYVPPGMSGYSLSKFAVRAFGDGLRREMKGFDVYVSVIEPTFYKTAISDETLAVNQMNKFWEQSPTEVQKAYGHIHDYREHIVKMFLKTAHSQLEDVEKTLVMAVETREPEFYYPIVYFFDRIAQLLEAVPEEINDCITNEIVGPPILRFIGMINEAMNA
ncbi:Short-chain dehydrogenase/reductase family 9C member 7 [Halotydeus destructor]|nr:Short-chain dehydrogenase/reductase family 9C member 7 [Halotydeus destructor]